MKKLLSFLMMLVLVLSLTACNKDKETEKEEAKTEEVEGSGEKTPENWVEPTDNTTFEKYLAEKVNSFNSKKLDELVGDVKGKIANSKFAVYNSIFNKLDIDLSRCNLDLDNVVIKEIDVLAENTQLLLIDVYGNNMKYEITNSNMQYYNNDSKKLINKIVLKSVNSQYDIDETVNCGELKIE
jgi:hypothetical protein